MSLDFNVYVHQIDDTIIPKWIERMNQMGMECEIYPKFSFENHSGFLPFKIRVESSRNPDLVNKEFVTGFEFYLNEFNLDSEIEQLKPKKNFFQKIFKNAPEEEEEVVLFSKEIDAKLRGCKKVMTFNWGSADTFEFRMASMSSAILSELIGGICCYPADDIWYDNATLVEDMYKEVVEYENLINPQDWKVHPFSEWE